MRVCSPHWSLVPDSLCNPCLLSCLYDCVRIRAFVLFSGAQVSAQMCEGWALPVVCPAAHLDTIFISILYTKAEHELISCAVIEPLNHGKIAQSGLTKLHNSMVLDFVMGKFISQTVHYCDIIMSYYVTHCQVIWKCQLRITTCGSFFWYPARLNNMTSVTVDLFCGFARDV